MNAKLKSSAIHAHWRGLNSLDIMRELCQEFDIIPGSREEDTVSHAVADLRSQIEKIKALVPDWAFAGFAEYHYDFNRVYECLRDSEDVGGLIPDFNLRGYVQAAQNRYEAPARAAVAEFEREEAEKRKAANEAMMEQAKAALRKMGDLNV
jgi:hypothetical protein